MKTFTCPRCNKNGISFKDKYRAAIWQIIYCNNCKARLCATPLVLALAYIVYVWMAITFMTMAHYQDNLVFLVYLVIGWIILDLHNIMFMPLTVMQQKNE